VTVNLRQVNSEAEITVADTGQGINAEFLPFVFDRFRQADSTSTRQHGGLGLGLAIARHLIEIHGGAIQARSAGEGQGATLSVTLPLAGSVAMPNTDANIEIGLDREELVKPAEALSGLHVLVVDDDEDTLELLRTALAKRGAKVSVASSASEALEAINNSRPDVLVSDIAMPGEDGYALIRNVRALDVGQAIPAIAITAYAKEEDKERVLSAGYQRFLSKPVELGELIETVAELARNGFSYQNPDSSG
jgi:CheY-like chemotaxis protein